MVSCFQLQNGILQKWLNTSILIAQLRLSQRMLLMARLLRGHIFWSAELEDFSFISQALTNAWAVEHGDHLMARPWSRFFYFVKWVTVFEANFILGKSDRSKEWRSAFSVMCFMTNRSQRSLLYMDERPFFICWFIHTHTHTHMHTRIRSYTWFAAKKTWP